MWNQPYNRANFGLSAFPAQANPRFASNSNFRQPNYGMYSASASSHTNFASNFQQSARSIQNLITENASNNFNRTPVSSITTYNQPWSSTANMNSRSQIQSAPDISRSTSSHTSAISGDKSYTSISSYQSSTSSVTTASNSSLSTRGSGQVQMAGPSNSSHGVSPTSVATGTVKSANTTTATAKVTSIVTPSSTTSNNSMTSADNEPILSTIMKGFNSKLTPTLYEEITNMKSGRTSSLSRMGNRMADKTVSAGSSTLSTHQTSSSNLSTASNSRNLMEEASKQFSSELFQPQQPVQETRLQKILKELAHGQTSQMDSLQNQTAAQMPAQSLPIQQPPLHTQPVPHPLQTQPLIHQPPLNQPPPNQVMQQQPPLQQSFPNPSMQSSFFNQPLQQPLQPHNIQQPLQNQPLQGHLIPQPFQNQPLQQTIINQSPQLLHNKSFQPFQNQLMQPLQAQPFQNQFAQTLPVKPFQNQFTQPFPNQPLQPLGIQQTLQTQTLQPPFQSQSMQAPFQNQFAQQSFQNTLIQQSLQSLPQQKSEPSILSTKSVEQPKLSTDRLCEMSPSLLTRFLSNCSYEDTNDVKGMQDKLAKYDRNITQLEEEFDAWKSKFCGNEIQYFEQKNQLLTMKEDILKNKKELQDKLERRLRRIQQKKNEKYEPFSQSPIDSHGESDDNRTYLHGRSKVIDYGHSSFAVNSGTYMASWNDKSQDSGRISSDPFSRETKGYGDRYSRDYRSDISRDNRDRSRDYSSRNYRDDSFRDRSPRNIRGRSPRTIRDRSPRNFRDKSPRSFRDRSPRNLRDRSPRNLRDRSPRNLRDRSPRNIRDRSPRNIRDRSPRRLRDRSPRGIRDRSPRNFRDRSPRNFRDRFSRGLRDEQSSANKNPRDDPKNMNESNNELLQKDNINSGVNSTRDYINDSSLKNTTQRSAQDSERHFGRDRFDRASRPSRQSHDTATSRSDHDRYHYRDRNQSMSNVYNQRLNSSTTEQATNQNKDDGDDIYEVDCHGNRITKSGDTQIAQAETVCITNLLNHPLRVNRPRNILIVMRGLPGAGKTYVVKLIKEKELASDGQAPRILSIDDYFMVEESGATGNDKPNKYEYDANMESVYLRSLERVFRKTVDDGFFRFIIIDCVNNLTAHFMRMADYASDRGFKVYVIEMLSDVNTCFRNNTHNRTLADIKRLEDSWQRSPASLTLLDVRAILQDASIQNIEMEDVVETESAKTPTVAEQTPDTAEISVISRWEKMDSISDLSLDKLDGISKKPSTREIQVQDIRDYLSCSIELGEESKDACTGRKKVRWADLEQMKKQKKARDVGFVVGSTNWSDFTDQSQGKQALTQTKFI